MAEDIIPSIYGQRPVEFLPFFDGNLFNNIKFRQGVVREIVRPESDRSVSKLFNEYDVLVDFFENGAPGSKMYRNCMVYNPLAGAADKSGFTLRASTKSVDDYQNSDGSRVVLLCLEGSYNQALIIGGLRDERGGGDLTKDGHHFFWEFNGVSFKVNDDGSWDIVNKGKTDNLGQVDSKANKDGIGTSIKVLADGSFSVLSPKGQTITINNKTDTITIKGNSDVVVDGDKIHLGEGANQQAVLGNALVGVLKDLIGACQKMTHFSFGIPGTTTGPPLNIGEFAAIAAKLQTILSQQTYVKKR